MIDNRDWHICHKCTDELRGKESDNKSKKKDSMTDNRDRHICHKCTDDKHQYHNHCCKCGELVLCKVLRAKTVGQRGGIRIEK